MQVSVHHVRQHFDKMQSLWIVLLVFWYLVSSQQFSQIYEIFCRDKTYLKIAYDILPDILSVTNMMVIGNLEVMPDKIKHCKKLCTEMDCFTIFIWFLLTSLSRFWSKVDIMSYFHKFSCTECNKTQLHALSQNERICYKQWSCMYRDEIFTCFAVTSFMIISEIILLAETQVPFQIQNRVNGIKQN